MSRSTITCECKRCGRCGGSGTEHWYLGDEFNSRGYSECGTCGGSGIDIGDCPIHHNGSQIAPPERNWDPEAGDPPENPRL